MERTLRISERYYAKRLQRECVTRPVRADIRGDTKGTWYVERSKAASQHNAGSSELRGPNTRSWSKV